MSPRAKMSDAEREAARAARREAELAAAREAARKKATEDQPPYLSGTDDEPSAAVQRKLPGKAKVRADAIRDAQEHLAAQRARTKPVFWWLVARDYTPETFRWRTEWDCGCIHEVLTERKDRLPTELQWLDPVVPARLPYGQFLCCKATTAGESPYRKIVGWAEVPHKVRTFPPDPPEPQHGLDPESWAKVRRTEEHTVAYWMVRLECGHAASVPARPGWRPADGHVRKDEEERQKTVAYWRDYVAYVEAEGKCSEWDRHHLARAEDGCPEPDVATDCRSCAAVSTMIAYEPIGLLLPPAPKSKAAPPKPSREEAERALRRKLKLAEDEAARLRAELDGLA